MSPYLPNNLQLVGESDNNLLNLMKGLLHEQAINTDLQNVATDYFNRFKNKTGGDYFNVELCEYLLTNAHTIATVKEFGELLNEKLKAANGDISAVNIGEIDFPVRFRAQYAIGEKFSGLRILINDTEKLIVYDMGDYFYDATSKEWEGTFYFHIFDNFGLDEQDLIDYQGKLFLTIGNRFAAWWILQHIRDYKPFRTEIRTAFKIKGDLDN